MGTPVTPEIATLAVLVAAPVAFLGRLGEREGEIWNQRIAALAELELSIHRLRAAARCNLYGLGASFLVSALLAPAAAALAVLVIPSLLRAAPALAAPLRVGFFALAALACAAAAKALRARAAPLSFFGAAAATAVLGLVGVLAGRAL
jgi:PTS system mannose-specific IIC component